jgi:hypothetical protein
MTNEIPQVVEINCETGEETYRPMTAEELADREQARIAWEAEQVAIATEKERIEALKASAKVKLIAGQPLTEDEAATIVF